jgi:hypothetical protein
MITEEIAKPTAYIIVQKGAPDSRPFSNMTSALLHAMAAGLAGHEYELKLVPWRPENEEDQL